MDKIDIKYQRKENVLTFKGKNKRVIISTPDDMKDEYNTQVTTMRLVIVEDIEARKNLLKNSKGLVHTAIGREHSKYFILFTFLELDMMTAVMLHEGLGERLTNKNKLWPNKIRNVK